MIKWKTNLIQAYCHDILIIVSLVDSKHFNLANYEKLRYL